MGALLTSTVGSSWSDKSDRDEPSISAPNADPGMSENPHEDPQDNMTSPLESLLPTESNRNKHGVGVDPEKETRPQRLATLRRKKPDGPHPLDDGAPGTDNPLAPPTPPATQPFWKFHILKFGLCLYLTTNPTLQHLHCRNAPGYFVKIAGTASAHSMAFEDIETGEVLVTVDKVSDRGGSQYVFQVKSKRCLRDGQMKNGENCSTREKNTLRTNAGDTHLDDYRGALHRRPIPQVLLPTAPRVPMLNYESTMIDGRQWSVGSLPRCRESRLNPKETKYIAKKHVYFHRCFQDLDRYHEWDVPPAIAVYRECETKAKKRVIRQLNRLSHVNLASASKKAQLSETAASPFTEIASYYESGDGLYFDTMPADDEPNHHDKLGWVTVYEDKPTFSHDLGMFDLVVALTVAIGYECSLNYGPIH